MIVICPTCRAPSNTSERQCWVCRRRFDGSEAVIGEVPWARKPLRLSDVHDYKDDLDDFDWRRAQSG